MLKLAADILLRFPHHLHLQVKFKPPVDTIDHPHEAHIDKPLSFSVGVQNSGLCTHTAAEKTHVHARFYTCLQFMGEATSGTDVQCH